MVAKASICAKEYCRVFIPLSLAGENPPYADFSLREPIYILRSETMANEEMKMIKKPLALALILAALPAAAMAQNCGDLTLDVCPTPYDQTLPAAKDMLT